MEYIKIHNILTQVQLSSKGCIKKFLIKKMHTLHMFDTALEVKVLI